MATMKTDAQKVTELRKQAMDKSLPQEVRDMADKKANEIEGKSVKKATGMELAKGGMAKKKYALGGAVLNTPKTPPMATTRKPTTPPMATKPKTPPPPVLRTPPPKHSGDVRSIPKTPPAPRPTTPSSDPLSNFGVSKTRMAKGGSVAKKAKK